MLDQEQITNWDALREAMLADAKAASDRIAQRDGGRAAMSAAAREAQKRFARDGSAAMNEARTQQAEERYQRFLDWLPSVASGWTPKPLIYRASAEGRDYVDKALTRARREGIVEARRVCASWEWRVL